MPEIRTWASMRARIQAQLERQSGHGVETWEARTAERTMSDESLKRRARSSAVPRRPGPG